jgi:hypothetical protein
MEEEVLGLILRHWDIDFAREMEEAAGECLAEIEERERQAWTYSTRPRNTHGKAKLDDGDGDGSDGEEYGDEDGEGERELQEIPERRKRKRKWRVYTPEEVAAREERERERERKAALRVRPHRCKTPAPCGRERRSPIPRAEQELWIVGNKEIAAFFDVSHRTAQRLHCEYGLQVVMTGGVPAQLKAVVIEWLVRKRKLRARLLKLYAVNVRRIRSEAKEKWKAKHGGSSKGFKSPRIVRPPWMVLYAERCRRKRQEAKAQWRSVIKRWRKDRKMIQRAKKAFKKVG